MATLGPNLDIVSIFNDIKKEIDLKRVRLDERVFQSAFVPLFFEQDNKHPDVTWQTWMNLAGGPHCEVSVVDSNGAELFVVPPLYNNRAVNPLNSGDGQKLYKLMAAVESKTRSFPKLGEEMMVQGLSQFRFTSEKKNELATETTKRWDAIKERYVQPDGKPVKDATGKKSSPPVADDDVFEF